MTNIQPFPDRSPLPFDPAMPAETRDRLLRKSLPEPLRAALETGRTVRRSRFSDDGFSGIAEDWVPPDGITAAQAALARRALAEMQATVLAPAPVNHLLARILALLSHYPAKGTTPEVEQMLAMDWAEDLGEFPAWAVDSAARLWRRTRKWRPSIAEMRSLCEDACAGERALAERLAAVARAGKELAPPPSDGPITGGPAAGATVRRLAAGALRRVT